MDRGAAEAGVEAEMEERHHLASAGADGEAKNGGPHTEVRSGRTPRKEWGKTG